MSRGEPHLIPKRGRRNWYVSWTDERGKTRLQSTGIATNGREEPCADAENYLADFIHERDAVEDLEGCAPVIDRYVKERRDVMDPERLRWAAKPLKKHFGEMPPERITETDCREYARRKLKSGARVAPGTARRELGMLRSALKASGYNVTVWLPEKSTPRDRILTQDDAQALLAAAGLAHLYLYILIGLATGARKGAILGLTWKRVDLDRLVIDFNEPGRRQTKKRRAVAPIGPQLAAALTDAKQVAVSDFVIEWNGGRVEDIKKGFSTAATNAGVPWCTPHYLKHTAISWFAEAGWSDTFISELTETHIETVKAIYRKVNPDQFRPMAESQEAVLFGEKQSPRKLSGS